MDSGEGYIVTPPDTDQPAIFAGMLTTALSQGNLAFDFGDRINLSHFLHGTLDNLQNVVTFRVQLNVHTMQLTTSAT